MSPKKPLYSDPDLTPSEPIELPPDPEPVSAPSKEADPEFQAVIDAATKLAAKRGYAAVEFDATAADTWTLRLIR